MDCQIPCTSSLARVWAIETLACSNHADTSLLLEFVKKTPEMCNAVGKNAIELVSLKILESLLIQGVRVNTASSQTIRLDPSDSCEGVLRRMLEKTCPMSLKSAVTEMLKWDLEPFIEHKRSNLPKCALKQLKDAIYTGSHSISASLKERSGLPVGNQAEHEALVKDGDSDGITPRVEGSDTHDSFLLPRDLPDKNLVRVNRKRIATCETAAGMSCMTHINSVKKYKHENISTEQYLGGKSISSGAEGQIAVMPALSVPQNEERCSLEKKTHVEVMGQKGPSGDGNCNECTSPKGLVANDEVVPTEKQAPHCGAEVLNETFDKSVQHSKGENAENGRRSFNKLISVNKDVDNFKQNVQRTARTIGEAEDDVDISADDDEYHYERIDIDTKKKLFLSSQDSLATIDWRELQLCMKCKNGGKLLSCASGSCPMVIHEGCLGSDASFDARGKFYCPFCAYSRGILKFMEVKKKTSLARKDLATFICLGSQQKPKKHSQRPLRIKGNLQQNNQFSKSNKVDVRSKKRFLHPSETDLPCERKCSRSSESPVAEELSEEDNESSSASKYFISDLRQERQKSSIGINSCGHA